MAKRFYTERDIEDLAHSGQMVLEVSDNVVLTELAYESAHKLGVRLVQPNDLPPAAPVRPYLSQPQAQPAGGCPCSEKGTDEESMRKRIREAVAAKLGNQVDPALLETIITRVLNNIGVK